MPLGRGTPLASNVEFVTFEHIERVSGFSRETGKPAFPVERARLQVQFVWLYDPPIEGITPLDGAGEPRASAIRATEAAAALAKGFTAQPVVKGAKKK